MSLHWRVEKQEWKGERCFILGGGPSVRSQNLELIKGQHLIAINTSYEAAPWAEFLVFSDSRWWDHHKKKLGDFKGKIIGTSVTSRGPPQVHRMHRKKPPGLANDIGTLSIKFTTLSAAINLAVHLGATEIVLLGIDGKIAQDGKTHHHSLHPWKQMAGCWDKQKTDLIKIAEELRERNISCVNASPDSTWEFWPKVNYLDTVQSMSMVA